jgi:hypothetical protein
MHRTRFALSKAYRRNCALLVQINPVASFSTTKPPAPSSSSKSLVLKDPASSLVNPWTEVKDKKTALVYYWNPQTNETTPVGASKPRHWAEVKDPNGSELTYWWDPESNETTTLGAPKPSSNAYPAASTAAPPPFQNVVYQPQSFGSAIKTYFFLGAGLTCGIVLVRSIIGF